MLYEERPKASYFKEIAICPPFGWTIAVNKKNVNMVYKSILIKSILIFGIY